MLTIKARGATYIQLAAQRFYDLLVLGCVMMFMSLVGYPLIQSVEAAEFDLVPDRPGYTDSTLSVAPRHWHIHPPRAAAPRRGEWALMRQGANHPRRPAEL